METTPLFFKCTEGACILQTIQGDEHTIIEHLNGIFKKIDPLMTEGASEKHLPVAEYRDQKIYINVGSVLHPMTDEHSIDWIYLQTSKGGHLISLDKTSTPQACFSLCEEEKAVAVYAYCNQHGLWKTDL